MQQRSQAWLDARVGRVTGSRIGAILGLSPWQSADDVLRAMVREAHGAESEFQGNAATEYGTFHESGAIAEFELQAEAEVQECGLFVHPEHDWLAASPDGIVVDWQGLGPHVLEVKCPYSMRDNPPIMFRILVDQPHYHAQVQYEMLCSGLDRAVFVQWCPSGLVWEDVDLDHDFIADTLPRLAAFHRRYLKAVEHPEEHLAPRRKRIETLTASKLLQEYDELGDAADRANQRRKEILAELVQIAGEEDAEVCGRKLTLVRRQGAVRYAEALKQYAPDADLEPFRGAPSESWRLT